MKKIGNNYSSILTQADKFPALSSIVKECREQKALKHSVKTLIGEIKRKLTLLLEKEESLIDNR